MNFILLLNVCIILLSITGDSDGKKRSKIVGIVLSHLSTYPYLVSLQYRELHFCTGVILGSRHILTTASCVLIDRGILYANLKILSGTPDVGNSANDGQYYDVKYTACHEDYNPHQFFKNDICILVLTKPLLYNENCQGGFIENKMPNDETFKKNLVVVGFHEQQLPLPTRIGSSFVKILDDSKCLDEFPINIIYQQCALPTTLADIITFGDGGTPVTYRKKIMGIVSAIPLNRPSSLFIYTNIVEYSKWIKNSMRIYCVLIDRGILYANLKILSGTPDVGNSANYGRYYDVEYTACHEDYNPHQFFKNDICILVLTKPLLYNENCQGGFIENKMRNDGRLRKNLIVVGFHEQLFPSSTKIGSSYVKVLDDSKCLDEFPINIIYQQCALPTTLTNIITFGDSGSPLTYRKKITGIVSAILLDCPTSLFIYTNVVEYSRWIKSSMEIY
ncbi:kallikrein 1-related peptidase b16-like [Aphidius gifuensis]|uniref:kallikrein 1-related peptidase b16-like n=1 Tax=Aphidius gifuensis TaxID=684658 RepID=UPI001CDC7AC0|nr:kallikrein 1-related peptidase b16-like [Aphidius gifuensis]